MARRTLYDPRKLELVEAWARNGLTHEEIAANLGIGVRTLYDWQREHEDFADALASGREVADLLVENALFRRAVGFQYDETTRETRLNPQTGNYELFTTKIVTKTVAPDVAAAVQWLTNRKPDVWRREPAPLAAVVSADNGFMAALQAAAPSVWADELQGGPDNGDAA